MGRNKIDIKRIDDDRKRQTTFRKRKEGLLKKARELSVLCNAEIAIVIFSKSNGLCRLYDYASDDLSGTLAKVSTFEGPVESRNNGNFFQKIDPRVQIMHSNPPNLQLSHAAKAAGFATTQRQPAVDYSHYFPRHQNGNSFELSKVEPLDSIEPREDNFQEDGESSDNDDSDDDKDKSDFLSVRQCSNYKRKTQSQMEQFQYAEEHRNITMNIPDRNISLQTEVRRKDGKTKANQAGIHRDQRRSSVGTTSEVAPNFSNQNFLSLDPELVSEHLSVREAHLLEQKITNEISPLTPSDGKPKLFGETGEPKTQMNSLSTTENQNQYRKRPIETTHDNFGEVGLREDKAQFQLFNGKQNNTHTSAQNSSSKSYSEEDSEFIQPKKRAKNENSRNGIPAWKRNVTINIPRKNSDSSPQISSKSLLNFFKPFPTPTELSQPDSIIALPSAAGLFHLSTPRGTETFDPLETPKNPFGINPQSNEK